MFIFFFLDDLLLVTSPPRERERERERDSTFWNDVYLVWRNIILRMYNYCFHKVQSINACPYAHFMATEEKNPDQQSCTYISVCTYILLHVLC